MIRVWIQKVLHSDDELPRTDEAMLRRAGFEIVDHPKDATYGIINHMWGDNYFAPLPRSRVVALYDEPPAPCHIPLYRNPQTFHTWFTFVPMSGDNVFQFTEDPIVYPYAPETGRDRIRRNTTMRTRGVFFRGAIREECKATAAEFGSIPLYNIRARFIWELKKCGTTFDLGGEGFGQVTRYPGIWPKVKRFEIDQTGADFALCVENSMIDGGNYITEKLHNAMQADLVALYLGSPQIEDYVPPGAFINLNPYFSRAEGRVDASAVHKLLQSISQEEYDHILHTARAWRRTDMLEERHLEARARVTRMIISRLS